MYFPLVVHMYVGSKDSDVLFVLSEQLDWREEEEEEEGLQSGYLSYINFINTFYFLYYMLYGYSLFQLYC